jgi:raffinose/stachyose/melibiose transport system substrate-binding protein
MKKSASMLMTAGLSVTMLLAGCSSTSSPSPNAGGAQSTPAKSPVTISFMSWYPVDSMQPIVDDFQKAYPNIKVELQFVPPTDQYIQKLKVVTLANQAPDIFYLAGENQVEMIKNGYTMDITDQPVFKNLSDSNKKAYTMDGKIYAYAPDAWAGGFIYNKDLFAKVGAQPPKTWSELMDVMGKLKAAGIRPIIERSTWLWTSADSLFMNDVIAQDPAFDAEVNSGTKTYADGWTKPLQTWYKDMVQTGYLAKDLLGVGPQQFTNEFATGKAGMLVGHLGHLKGVKDVNPNINVGVFPMVGTNAGTKFLYGAVNVGIAVNSKTQHKEEALQFLNFMSKAEELQKYQKVTGFLLGVPGVDYTIDPAFNEIKDMYVNNKAQLYVPQVNFGANSAAILNELVKGTQDVLSGGAKPEDVPARMDAKRKELQK